MESTGNSDSPNTMISSESTGTRPLRKAVGSAVSTENYERELLLPDSETCTNDSHRIDIPATLSSVASKTDKTANTTNSDFVFIKIVARITLQLLRRFWAFSSAGVLAIILFYWLCGGFIAFGMVAFAFTGLLYHAGDRLLYHPEQPATARVFVPSPSMFGLAFENIYIKSRDHTRLHMFLVTASPTTVNYNRKPSAGGGANSSSQSNGNCGATSEDVETAAPPTILFLHGNAGNIGHR